MLAIAEKSTLESLLVRAVNCETRCAKIYAELSARCRSVPSVATFWDSFSDDEIDHADFLQQIKRSLNHQQLSVTPTDEQWQSLLKAEDFLSGLSVEYVQNLEDAYELAHEIEKYELMMVIPLLAHSVQDKQLHASMKAQLDEHVHRLEGIGLKWGNAAERSSVRFKTKG